MYYYNSIHITNIGITKIDGINKLYYSISLIYTGITSVLISSMQVLYFCSICILHKLISLWYSQYMCYNVILINTCTFITTFFPW